MRLYALSPHYLSSLLINSWTAKEVDNGNEIYSIFFDLRKAFDSVPHMHFVDNCLVSNFVLIFFNGFIVICLIGLRLFLLVVNFHPSKMLCRESPKVRFWDLCCSLSTSMMWWPRFHPPARSLHMQMILPCMAASLHLLTMLCCKQTLPPLPLGWRKKDTWSYVQINTTLCWYLASALALFLILFLPKLAPHCSKVTLQNIWVFCSHQTCLGLNIILQESLSKPGS